MIEIIPFEERYTEQMIEVARIIHQRSIYFDVPLDAEKLKQQLAASGGLAPDRYFRLAVEDGLLLGAFYGCVMRTFFSPDMIAKDMGQWTRRDGRQKNAFAVLLTDFEAWARAKGARMSGLGYSMQEADNIETMRRVAEMVGYRVVGYNLVKDL